jgi:uncharacterized protein (TIGR00251 family)
MKPMRILRIKVKPNARSSQLRSLDDGTWRAQLTSPPVDGKANDELIALVARHFALPRARVAIKSGATARLKLVTVDDT